MLSTLVENKTKEQLDALGNESSQAKESGAHLVTIQAVYDTKGEKNGKEWNSITAEFVTDSGESVTLSEFYGSQGDGSEAALEKMERSNTRVLAIITRLAKAAGIPDLKAATAGAQPGTDAKGRTTTIYPKFAKKKLYVVTTTEISPSQDGTKAYANQIVDTNKFLNKDGNDQMGRNRVEAFDSEAKTTVEIAYNQGNNPACIALFAKLQEQAAPVAPTNLPGMPTATPQAVTTDDDDI